MQAPTRGLSRRPVGITQGDIVDTALEIVRTAGVAKLSMRTLAGALGVQAPTLYHHVRDKAALLDLISAEAFRSLERPGGAYEKVTTLEEWSAAMRADVVRLRNLYRAHPGLAREVVDHARMEDAKPPSRDGDRTGGASDPPELTALLRLEVPRERAMHVIEAGARWTMAALAAEDSVADRAVRDRLFIDGLALLLRGMVAALESARQD